MKPATEPTVIEARLQAENRALLGLLQAHPSTAVSELAGMAGYDFVMLDCEHGLFDELELLQALQAIKASDCIGIIRLRGQDHAAVGRYLDLGAAAIVVPNVTTADEATRLVKAARYPPLGTRGVGAALHRGTHYGLAMPADLQFLQPAAMLILMIESVAGCGNAAAILAVDGVDGVLLGPSDLSADCGGLGDYRRPSFISAVARLEEAAKVSGKLLATGTWSTLPDLVMRGYRLLILGADILLLGASMRAQVDDARRSIESQKS